ncbi:MAG: secretin N-terminal domain-containing protein [Schlesneria sp.]
MKTHESGSEPNGRADLRLLASRSPFRHTCNGLAIASGLAVVGWLAGIMPSTLTAPHISAATKPKPGERSTGLETAEARLKLTYYSASWPRVFQDIAEAGDLDFVADRVPHGRFSRLDRTEYSIKDAIRIINKELEPQSLRLIVKANTLILLETTAQRPQYPPAVLPKRAAPKESNEEQEESIKPAGFRSESMTGSRDDRGNINSNQEIVAQKSMRYTGNKGRPQAAETEPVEEQIPAPRKLKPSRAVRQTSHEEFFEEPDAQPSRKPHPFESKPPKDLENVGAAAAPAVVYRTRHLRAVDLSKRVYGTMKASAELVDSGRNGLPAFRVVTKPSKVETTSGEKIQTNPVQFMISIDEPHDELLIDGNSKSIDAVLKLLKVLDQPQDGQTKTHVKASTQYVCQIADQLPAEIDRIRAARGTDVKSRLAQAESKDDPFPSTSSSGADGTFGGALGNFKGEVNIQVIEDLNVMVIVGNEKDVAQVEQVIKQIEQLAVATAPRVELLHLKNVDSESLAELLTSVYEKLTKFPGKATQPRESVAIIPVTKPNSLLIVAPGADLENILSLAEELDQPVDPETEFQVFSLKSAIASEVETLLTEFYKDRKSLGAKILVIADSRSNSLIVRARARDLEEIQTLIRRLDREGSESISQVRIFALKNAVATELAAVINSAIQSVLSPPSSSGGGGGQGQQQGLGGGQVEEQFKNVKSQVLQFLSIDKGNNSRELQSGVLSDIRVTPEAHSNSLIVTASEKSMDLIEALITNLDRPTNTVSEIKVFTLEHADANQMVQQLNALFNGQTQGQGANGNQQRPLLGIQLANADDASSSLVPLKFSVDTRTNSVIAVGSGDALRVVEAIMLRLDESDLRSRKNMVVRLNNTPATQIAQAVTTFFQQQRDLTQLDPNLTSNVEQLEREVIVIPDTISNSLLVSSTPRYYPDILAMIRKLDSVPKQVVIQALIVEVQLNNTDEFGIELGLQNPIFFNRSVLDPPVILTETTTAVTGLQTTTQHILAQTGSPGFNFNNAGLPLGNNLAISPGTVAGQGLSNFSLGRVNNQLGYGGLVLSAGSDAVNVLLRALAANRKLTILSRPQIRALDSQLAEVFVGQTIPTVTAFNTNATTGVLSPILTQRETGIGMQVTPRINDDGNIVIQMYAYRSQLSQETVTVTTDSRGVAVGQRITDLSNVRSTVLVPSNSTIVIGGMISSRDESFTRKAPLLGDLPLVGSLFRYDSRSSIRTELLIFLTPRIINGPEEEECLKDIEMGRIHFIESEAEEAHGPLRALPAADEMIEEEHIPWVQPVLPPVPSMNGSPVIQKVPQELPESIPARSPSALPPAPAVIPPSPAEQAPSVPPPPPLPDPNVTRINASRMQATEMDDAETGVSKASFVKPEAPKKRGLFQKRTVGRSN